MKRIFQVNILLALLSGCFVTKHSNTANLQYRWTKQRALKHFQNLQDSTLWDTSIVINDLKGVNPQSKDFMTYGVFPIPNYDLIGVGSFKGLGFYQGHTMIQHKHLLFNSFYIKRNTLNAKRLGTRKDEVFFLIIVLTDTVDTVTYSHTSTHIVSRNHPDYIGEGSFFEKKTKINYLAFTTAERNNYAIVNMRLFNLGLGKAVLIAPQTDGSFRSLQFSIPDINSTDIDRTVNDLIKNKSINRFFTRQGNIE